MNELITLITSTEISIQILSLSSTHTGGGQVMTPFSRRSDRAPAFPMLKKKGVDF